MSDTVDSTCLLNLTAQIVAAHLANNPLPSAELPALIETVHCSLAGLGQAPAGLEHPVPAVPIKKSVFPDYIVCLEDSKKLKMLKRHLKTAYNMTPAEYRAKWGVSREYPMVAPHYAERRSSLAKKIGLGHRPAAIPHAAPVARQVRRARKQPAA